jgi:hypothetical protein
MIKEVFDSRNRVSVSECDFIQGPVINAKLLGPIFLLHQHDWAPTRRCTGADVPLMEKFLDLPLDLLIFY